MVRKLGGKHIIERMQKETGLSLPSIGPDKDTAAEV